MITLEQLLKPIDKKAKTCSGCKELKGVAEFWKNASQKDGLCPLCKRCSRAYRKRRYHKNQGKLSRYQRLYKHGLTEEEFIRMTSEQRGACAICQKVTKLVIDHNHKTSAVRELLCPKCNTGLGQFGDCAEQLLAAANYIKKHS